MRRRSRNIPVQLVVTMWMQGVLPKELMVTTVSLKHAFQNVGSYKVGGLRCYSSMGELPNLTSFRITSEAKASGSSTFVIAASRKEKSFKELCEEFEISRR